MSGSSIFIYHHLGLGDHFICNGIIRALAEKFNKIHLFCKHHNVMTVAQMYEDINVELIPVSDDNDVFCRIQTLETDEVYSIGFGAMHANRNFDQQFYAQIGLDFSDRWNKFKCNRNKEREKKLTEQLNLRSEFALVHDDPPRGYGIDYYNKISLPMVMLKPIDGFSMIDWLTVAEKATEIHVIDSSFLFLADSVDLSAKRYIHRYARKFPEWEKPTLNEKWEIIL